MTTATRVWVRFEGVGRDFVAKQWPIPNHSNSFTPPPPDARALYVAAKKSFAINRPGDRRPLQLPFSYAKTWGLDEDAYTDVVFARASKKYCLRFIFNVEHTLKSMEFDTFKTYVRLVKDAKFHSDYLEGRKGLPVPVHYGIWVMNTGDWGGTVMFSLTQYCGISWNELRSTKFNTEANRINVGRAYEKLHDVGIVHGDFKSTREFRHAIVDLFAPGLTEKDALNGKAPCYLVGFSEASANHSCTPRLPILPLDSCPSLHEVGCAELCSVFFLLDFAKPPLENSLMSRALEWHTEYSKRYPQVENRYVLAAQRKRFYPQFLPLDPSLHVSVPNVDDPYSRVLITRDIHEDDARQDDVLSSGLQRVAISGIDSLPAEYRAALAKHKSLGPQFVVAF
ncbi:hypothetical protein R3P38DRAFT_3262682 [Favolaschia claudopus]|uniref:Protein kinase domain-containing protein n=1 Tax=Favolaschia claudopus TaxID=2862362 RepID=A0AAW0CK67_9AGAR